mmetsp:Transcript_35052/g.59332  ORF Transcript_35052/g.59332 Transcript_35052/m.59332 type:complete len:80 (+) Transcript_35052:1820-2059(+)
MNVHAPDNATDQKRKSVDSKQWPFGDKILDEYDPAKPNDYEVLHNVVEKNIRVKHPFIKSQEFVKMREEKFEAEERERR